MIKSHARRLTDDDLDAIARRLAAATAGPWRLSYGLVLSGDGRRVCRVQSVSGVGKGRLGSEEDGTFIVHSRADVEALVAEVARLRAALREVRGHAS
jgi:hypothetical protein